MVGGARVGGSSRLTGSSEPPKRKMLGHTSHKIQGQTDRDQGAAKRFKVLTVFNLLSTYFPPNC